PGRRHPARAKRRVGGPVRPLHDASVMGPLVSTKNGQTTSFAQLVAARGEFDVGASVMGPLVSTKNGQTTSFAQLVAARGEFDVGAGRPQHRSSAHVELRNVLSD